MLTSRYMRMTNVQDTVLLFIPEAALTPTDISGVQNIPVELGYHIMHEASVEEMREVTWNRISVYNRLLLLFFHY